MRINGRLSGLLLVVGGLAAGAAVARRRRRAAMPAQALARAVDEGVAAAHLATVPEEPAWIRVDGFPAPADEAALDGVATPVAAPSA